MIFGLPAGKTQGKTSIKNLSLKHINRRHTGLNLERKKIRVFTENVNKLESLPSSIGQRAFNSSQLHIIQAILKVLILCSVCLSEYLSLKYVFIPL